VRYLQPHRQQEAALNIGAAKASERIAYGVHGILSSSNSSPAVGMNNLSKNLSHKFVLSVFVLSRKDASLCSPQNAHTKNKPIRKE
jgi:hypothetical protein